MEHILVQVFKNLQFWKLPKTKKLKPPMVTIFRLNHPNLFFLNQYIQFLNQIFFSKVLHVF
jgi:hypothetical protein